MSTYFVESTSENITFNAKLVRRVSSRAPFRVRGVSQACHLRLKVLKGYTSTLFFVRNIVYSSVKYGDLRLRLFAFYISSFIRVGIRRI